RGGAGPLRASGAGGAEGGQRGGLTGEFTAGRRGRVGECAERRGEPCRLFADDGVGRRGGLSVRQTLRRLTVQPPVLLIGHRMSFGVRVRICVTLADVTARRCASRCGGSASSTRADSGWASGSSPSISASRFRPRCAAVRTAPGRLPRVSA